MVSCTYWFEMPYNTMHKVRIIIPTYGSSSAENILFNAYLYLKKKRICYRISVNIFRNHFCIVNQVVTPPGWNLHLCIANWRWIITSAAHYHPHYAFQGGTVNTDQLQSPEKYSVRRRIIRLFDNLMEDGSSEQRYNVSGRCQRNLPQVAISSFTKMLLYFQGS